MIRRPKRTRGSTTIEAMLVMVMISMLFWAFLLVFEMCLTSIVTNHAAFLMGRSHIVGFENDIAHRARNVGMIPISGHIMQPNELKGSDNVEIGGQEKYLIEQYIQERYAGGSEMLHYRFWSDRYTDGGSNPGILSSTLPEDVADSQEDVEDFKVLLRVKNYQGYTTTQSETTTPDAYHRFNNIPMFWRYYGWTKGTAEGALEFRMLGKARLLNHSAYYLDSGDSSDGGSL